MMVMPSNHWNKISTNWWIYLIIQIERCRTVQKQLLHIMYNIMYYVYYVYVYVLCILCMLLLCIIEHVRMSSWIWCRCKKYLDWDDKHAFLTHCERRVKFLRKKNLRPNCNRIPCFSIDNFSILTRITLRRMLVSLLLSTRAARFLLIQYTKTVKNKPNYQHFAIRP
jgi:hypothetical protein